MPELEMWTNDTDTVICEGANILSAYDAQYGLDDKIVEKVTNDVAKGRWSRIFSCTVTFEKRPKGIPRTASVCKIKEDSDDYSDAYDYGHRVAITMSAAQWAKWNGLGVLATEY